MKVLCPQCDRLSDLEQFRFDGAALIVTCSKCGVETRTQPGATPSPVPLTPIPTTPIEPYQSTMTPLPSMPRLSSSPSASNVVLLKTPTTEAVEKAAKAARTNPFEVPAGLCPKCVSRRQPSARSCGQCGLVFDMLDEKTLEPPDWLSADWKALLLSWGDEAEHDRIRKKAAQADALAIIGRLYRLRLATMPDDPYALRGREEIMRLASISVAPRASTDLPPSTSKAKIVIAALFFLLTMTGVLMTLRYLFSMKDEP